MTADARRRLASGPLGLLHLCASRGRKSRSHAVLDAAGLVASGADVSDPTALCAFETPGQLPLLNPSHRSERADLSLKETLNTMAVDLIPGACVRIPVAACELDAESLSMTSPYRELIPQAQPMDRGIRFNAKEMA